MTGGYGDTCIFALKFCTLLWPLRNIQFFGLEAQQKVTASYVVVIGLGGVGSHAASMLLRSGVGRLLLVDFDQVVFKGNLIHLYITLPKSLASYIFLSQNILMYPHVWLSLILFHFTTFPSSLHHSLFVKAGSKSTT